AHAKQYLAPVAMYDVDHLHGYAECLRELTSTIDIIRVVGGTGEEAKVFFAPHRSTDALVIHAPLRPMNGTFKPRCASLPGRRRPRVSHSSRRHNNLRP